jgi:hypothetical protein
MDGEGTSDVYIRAFIDEDNVKTTDTHYRCMDGNPSFSHRMLFDVQTPRDETKLVLQAYDRDIFSSNDFICEWELNLKDLMNVVKMTQTQAHFNKKYFESRKSHEAYSASYIQFKDDSTFYLCKMREGKIIKIALDLRVFTQKAAKEAPVGEARAEPNFEPYMPAPVGRLKFSLNPLTMLKQLMSPEFAVKIMMLLCAILYVVCFAMMIPTFFSDLFAEAFIEAFT